MKKIGMYMALFGIVSSALSLVGYNLKLLFWIEMWGESVGWGIRIALIVIGGLLFFLGAKEEAELE